MLFQLRTGFTQTAPWSLSQSAGLHTRVNLSFTHPPSLSLSPLRPPLICPPPPCSLLQPSTLLPLLLVNVLPASSPRQTGGTDAPSERDSDGETSDVPSLGRPRVSVQSAETHGRAAARWERTQGKSVSLHTEIMSTAGCRTALPLLT